MLNVSTQLQLFIDDWLIESMNGVSLKLHSPEPKEIAIRLDRPYETPNMYDPVVIKDGDRYRMWYRTNFDTPPHYTGYAESPDGVNWNKPSLGLIEFQGSKDNNLVWPVPGGEGHVLSIFKDENPTAPDFQRYKAIGIGKDGNSIVGLVSPDGLRWENLRQEPTIVGPPEDPHFDSHNIAFWDAARGVYVAYLRGWSGGGYKGIRRIRRTLSSDFLYWSPLEYLDLGDSPAEHLYKNAATPYYGRPDIILMFPKRFVPERKFSDRFPHPGLSDIVFMFSRDGLRFDRRFMEAFIRPGHDLLNWRDRAIEVGPTLVPTGRGEMSLYMMANYQSPSVHIRRMALREDGFVSASASYAGGEMLTKPLTFKGRELVMNCATAAAGSIRVEIQNADGTPFPGFGLEESAEIYGDELDRVVAWKGGSKVGDLAGNPIRIRFALKDADIHSIRFRT